MQYFCPQCNKLNQQDSCSFCGKHRLKTVTNDDFCFLAEVSSMTGEILKGIFEEEKIPCAVLPSGSGVRSFFALKLENLKIFVPYEFFDKANEILTNFKKDGNEGEKLF